MRKDHRVCTCRLHLLITNTDQVRIRAPSATRSAELTKRLRFNDEDIPYEDEFIEVSVNMVDKDTGKQPALEPENSATPDVYMRTRSLSGTISPVNYRALDQGQEKPKEHS